MHRVKTYKLYHDQKALYEQPKPQTLSISTLHHKSRYPQALSPLKPETSLNPSGSWDLPPKGQFPNVWKAAGMWKFVQRVLPDSYDQLKELVNSHYGDLPVLYEEVVHAMAQSLPLQQ